VVYLKAKDLKRSPLKEQTELERQLSLTPPKERLSRVFGLEDSQNTPYVFKNLQLKEKKSQYCFVLVLYSFT